VLRLVAVAAAAALVAGPSQPSAELQYLQHSAWLVKTSRHTLVFDYVESVPPSTQLPSDLRLSGESFDDRPVVVFISHGHPDHFFPSIGSWALKRPDIQFVVGWPRANVAGAKVIQPHETWSSGGLTVKATGSTDEGVGFLVTVDGLTILHAGDHARWSEADEHAFMAEIRWLKAQDQPIDLAFFPIATGATCDPRPSIWEGVRAAALELAPRVLVPMHVACSDRLDLYERFKKEMGAALPNTEIVAPTQFGEHFHYQAGRMAVE
jgi:L-ascorbate metabolism protein UlaG (beta-lactamase superfamily)